MTIDEQMKMQDRKLDVKLERSREKHRQWIEGIISSAQQRNWFGKITIQIKRGVVDTVTTEESLKPPGLIK